MFGQQGPECLSWSWKTALEQSPNTRQQERTWTPGEVGELINPQRDFCSWKEIICTKSLWFSLLGWVRAQSTFGNRAQKQFLGQSPVSPINTQKWLMSQRLRGTMLLSPERRKITAILILIQIYRKVAFEESLHIQSILKFQILFQSHDDFYAP